MEEVPGLKVMGRGFLSAGWRWTGPLISSGGQSGGQVRVETADWLTVAWLPQVQPAAAAQRYFLLSGL